MESAFAFLQTHSRPERDSVGGISFRLTKSTHTLNQVQWAESGFVVLQTITHKLAKGPSYNQLSSYETHSHPELSLVGFVVLQKITHNLAKVS
jgi:hypothetical protein